MKKIIIISAVWCPSCLILNKQLKELKECLKNIEIIRYDYDMDEDEYEKYDIGKTLPVLILEENEKELKRISGEKNIQEIKEFLK